MACASPLPARGPRIGLRMPPDHPVPSATASAQTEDVEEFRIGSSSLLGDDPVDLSDVLNTVLDRGAVVHGEVTIAVADVDLIRLNIGLLLQAIATAEARAPRDGSANSGSLAATLGALAYPRVPEPGAPILAKPVPESSGSPADTAVARADTSLNGVARGLPDRINADATGPESGLARLVLTLIEVLRKVLEHQAVRRMEGGRLTSEEIERLGLALARLDERMGELRTVFGISEEDLRIDLGPLGQLK